MALQFGEWITPDGRECPIDEHQVVQIERREGTISRGPSGHWSSTQRFQNSWWHNGYRPVYFTDTAA